jgi:hypothetical protein
MEESEFRERVYANPGAPDQELLDLARDNPAYQKILDQTRLMETEIASVLKGVVVPKGLRESLLQIPSRNAQSNEEQAARVESVVPAGDNSAANAASFFQYYAMAASLLLVIGVVFTLTFEPGQNELEVALGEEMINHLYHESNEIAAINAGNDLVTVQWNDVSEIMLSAGVQLASTLQQNSPVYYANPCIVLQAYSSAHLMLRGEEGAVSIIVINNSPVESEYRIQDDRFRGMIVPMEEGNLVLIGEDGENLELFKQLFSDNMEWVI